LHRGETHHVHPRPLASLEALGFLNALK
jgi:hypothetical protein